MMKRRCWVPEEQQWGGGGLCWSSLRNYSTEEDERQSDPGGERGRGQETWCKGDKYIYLSTGIMYCSKVLVLYLSISLSCYFYFSSSPRI